MLIRGIGPGVMLTTKQQSLNYHLNLFFLVLCMLLPYVGILGNGNRSVVSRFRLLVELFSRTGVPPDPQLQASRALPTLFFHRIFPNGLQA